MTPAARQESSSAGPPPRTLRARLLSRVGPLAGLLGVYLLFVIIGPSSFSSPGNLETIARQTAIVGTAALGMTMVIIAGGIDLSVGSVIALVTVLIASAMQAGFSPIAAVLTGVLGGTLCGLVNGTADHPAPRGPVRGHPRNPAGGTGGGQGDRP